MDSYRRRLADCLGFNFVDAVVRLARGWPACRPARACRTEGSRMRLCQGTPCLGRRPPRDPCASL